MRAIGHRVVHGGPDYDRPVLIDADVLHHLADYQELAPLHQPNNLAPIRLAMDINPDLPQVACFDTAFHRGHAAYADCYAIPKAFYDEGVRRYGFHGLSYEYIAEKLGEVAPDAARGRTVVAHLGSGASMCALAGGNSIESTMGFTALDGLPMGTRPGQIDPGVILYLIMQKGMTAQSVSDLLYRGSGLKGLSGIIERYARSPCQRRSACRLCHRPFHLSMRAERWNACRGPWRAGRLCLYSRCRRELRPDPCPHRREALPGWAQT